MNLPINKVTQLQDIYIFETAINQTIANIQKKKKNYFRLTLILLALLVVSLIWGLSNYRSSQVGINLTNNINNNISTLDTFTTTTTSSQKQTIQTTSSTTSNLDNIQQQQQLQQTESLYNTDVFQNRDDQSTINLQQSQKLTTIEYIIILLPSIILLILFIFSLIIYFSIDDPFLFISRCNTTLSLFNIYYCFTNKKIMILPIKYTGSYNSSNNYSYGYSNKSSVSTFNNNQNSTFQQNSNDWSQNYMDNEYNHRGNRLTTTTTTTSITQSTSTVHRTKKYDNLNNATIIIGNSDNSYSY